MMRKNLIIIIFACIVVLLAAGCKSKYDKVDVNKVGSVIAMGDSLDNDISMGISLGDYEKAVKKYTDAVASLKNSTAADTMPEIISSIDSHSKHHASAVTAWNDDIDLEMAQYDKDFSEWDGDGKMPELDDYDDLSNKVQGEWALIPSLESAISALSEIRKSM